MLTLGELKEKQAEPRKKRYYDRTEMDEFLEEVYKNYEELYVRNQELKKKIKTLSDGVQYYRSIETTLQQALILAEKTAKETKDAAILKAEAIEKEARVNADEIVNNAEQEYMNIKQQCIHLVKQFNQYKLQLKQAASAQIELVESDTFHIYSPELNKLYRENEAQSSIKGIGAKDETKNSEQPTEQLVEQRIEDASPLELDDVKVVNITETIPLETIRGGAKETPEESQTLDRLLKDLNMSNKKNRTSTQEESSDNDPFDFLGSVEDF